jgi:hypothetical protein
MRVGPGGRHPGGRKQTTIRGGQESRKPDRRGRSCSEGELSGCVRENAGQGWSGLCSRLLCHIDPFGCHQGSQFLRGKILERAPLLVEAGFEPQGDLVQLRRVDPPSQFGQLERIEVAESLPLPVQLHFHQQDDLLKLGMGLRGAAEHQGLVAPGQPMMIIVAVQAKADQGGSDAAGSCERLLRRDHLGVGLSRGDAEGRGMSSSDPSRSRSAAMLGTRYLSVCPRAANSPEIENRWRS